MWEPPTAIRMSKRNSTSHHIGDSTSTCTTSISAEILPRKLRRETILSPCTMSSIYPQKMKFMGVKSESVLPADPLTAKSSIQSTKNELVIIRHHPVGKWGRQNQLLSVGTKSSLAHPEKLHSWWCSSGGSVQQFGPTWYRTTRWVYGCRRHVR